MNATWNSASEIHNYMLNDPLLDYLNLAVEKPVSLFLNTIFDLGNKFEYKIVNTLFKDNYVKICNNQAEIKMNSKYEETLNEMKKGTPVIYQGSLRSEINHTVGSPDLLIRSDLINLLIPDADYNRKIDGCRCRDESE